MRENVVLRLRQLNILGGLVLSVCLFTSLCYAAFFDISLHRIVDRFMARDFLSRIGSIPADTRITILAVILCGILLTVNFFLRSYHPNMEKRLLLLSLIVDLVLCLVTIFLLRFNFNGILLWFFANVISYMASSRRWYFAMAAAVFVYTFTSPQVVLLVTNDYSLEDFLDTYSAGTQSSVLFGFNLLNISCIIGFIVMCVGVIAGKQRRLDEIGQLYERLSEVNTQLTNANSQMEDLMEENARMAEVRERNRIAREVHDTIGHTLTGLAVGIDACDALADESEEALKEQLRILSQVARQGIVDVRTSVAQLQPDTLQGNTLFEALKTLIDNTRKATRTNISFQVECPDLVLDEEEEHALFRIVQESMTNSIRHGHAKHIDIRFSGGADRVRITVKDDGIGSDSLEEGFGLHHMRERVEMLHGRITYTGKKGFLVSADIPVRMREVEK